MKPLRPKVALAIDGGGIRGTLVAKALAERAASGVLFTRMRTWLILANISGVR